jgi:hypothetical protein
VVVLDVVVYGLFGVSFGAITALLRVFVTAAIIIVTIRIPFKRTYHWMFLILSVVTILFAASAAWYELSPDIATATARDGCLTCLTRVLKTY